MLDRLRHKIVQSLWEKYRSVTPQMVIIEQALYKKHVTTLYLDHFAVIDLPSEHSGIPVLTSIFSALGYEPKGKGYLPEKQNDFQWLSESQSCTLPAIDALPQAVVADFRLEAMPIEISTIITKYATQAKKIDIRRIQQLAQETAQGNEQSSTQLERMILSYLEGRDWPKPTLNEFKTVQRFNELLAWVLAFGRRPNHFTLSIHLLSSFKSLENFHDFLKTLNIPLNVDGGVIKGGEKAGIAQSSTLGMMSDAALADGTLTLPSGFVEFVWRYPLDSIAQPKNWHDYFTGFIPQHADHVIQSLYDK
ncbi:MAG: DUF1338 domain-containing protein [Gammaproteobacteria bacterium]|nr:DUF1338 domain-containing protein [Gammaproteobacteria bacterium]